MVEGMGIRNFGAVQSKLVPGGVNGVLFASPKAPFSTAGEMRVSVALSAAGYNCYYLMNDGVNGNKLVLLGVVTNANQLYTFKFAFRNNCTYDIVITLGGGTGGPPVTIVDLDVEEIDAAVGY